MKIIVSCLLRLCQTVTVNSFLVAWLSTQLSLLPVTLNSDSSFFLFLPLAIPREQRRWWTMSSGHGRGLLTDVCPPPEMDDTVQQSLTALKGPHSTISLSPPEHIQIWALGGKLTLGWCVFVCVSGVPWHQCVCICVVAHRRGKFCLTTFSCCLKMNVLTLERRSLVLLWRMCAKQRSLQFEVASH